MHATRHQVVENVGNAYAILLAAQAGRRAGQEQVRAARVAFRGVREEAKLGARTTLDVLDAEQELLDAQANLISSETDVFIAAYTVLETIGQLTAKDLRLNVQLYDPAAYYNLVKDAPRADKPAGPETGPGAARTWEGIGFNLKSCLNCCVNSRSAVNCR